MENWTEMKLNKVQKCYSYKGLWHAQWTCQGCDVDVDLTRVGQKYMKYFDGTVR